MTGKRRSRQKIISRALIVLIILASVLSSWVSAEEFSSTNFILRDPVITPASGFSSSANFQYFSNTGQTATGEATSPTSYIVYSGFLYFATSTSPVLSATAGDSQVSLSWTEAIGTLANITNYQLGIATASGGPYTYQSLGNVYSYTKTGLTNGTAYYFIIKAYANTLSLSQSGESAATPVATAVSTTSTGGGGISAPATLVNFSGWAYPYSNVILLKDAQVAAMTIVGADSNFTINLTGLAGGSYVFSVYARDEDNRRSPLQNFPLVLKAGATTNVSGIFIAPTITLDKSEVKRGDNLAISGYSAANSNITITIDAGSGLIVQTKANKVGAYSYNFDTSSLDYGTYNVKSRASINNQFISGVSFILNFKVSTRNAPVEIGTLAKGDLNNDNYVNLIDFSIAAYWYGRVLSSDFREIEKEKLNGDGLINLVDFSILGYYWTG